MDRKDINHKVELIMAGIQKAVRNDLPKEFVIEVPRLLEDNTEVIKLYKLTVIEFAGTGDSWTSVKGRFDTAVALNPRFKEVRLHVYQDHVMLVGVTLIGKKEQP